MTGTDLDADRPYPLARRFLVRLLPAIAVFLAGLVTVTVLVTERLARNVYLDQATRRAESIAHDVSAKAPELWASLLTNQKLSAKESASLTRLLRTEEQEFRLVGLKVYDLTGLSLYASDPAETGRIETSQALHDAIAASKPSAQRHTNEDGTQVYELYVPYSEAGRMVAVFELYEPLTGGLASTLLSTIVPVLVIPSLLLAGLLALMVPIVRAAQSEIDRRNRVIVDMRHRLETLVSKRAVETMRHETGTPAIEKLELTLLYSDVRGFTAFSEGREPAAVIDTLNRLIALQVEAIERRGGDVDKIIGDAVFARFEGPRRDGNAIAAALDIQHTLQHSGIGLDVGVGVHGGSVVAGSIGAPNRRDYTVIGDTVNVVARLCSLAAPGEVIADTDVLERAGITSFDGPRLVQVKGRAGDLRIGSLRADSAERNE